MGGKGQYLLTLWAGLHVLYSGQCKVMGKVFLIHFFGACEGEDCWPKEKRKEEGAHIRNHGPWSPKSCHSYGRDGPPDTTFGTFMVSWDVLFGDLKERC